MPPPPPPQGAEPQDSSEGEEWDQQPWEVNLSSLAATRLFSTSYSTYEAIQADLRAFCEESCTGLVVRSSQKNKAKTEVVKAVFCCDRSRRSLRPSVAKKYATSTTKTSLHCPFQVILQALASNGGQWTARLVESRHEGHGPSSSPQEHRVLRRLTQEQLEFAVRLCTDQTITTRSIYKQLQQQWPDILYRQKTYTPSVEVSTNIRGMVIFQSSSLYAVFQSALIASVFWLIGRIKNKHASVKSLGYIKRALERGKGRLSVSNSTLRTTPIAIKCLL